MPKYELKGPGATTPDGRILEPWTSDDLAKLLEEYRDLDAEEALSILWLNVWELKSKAQINYDNMCEEVTEDASTSNVQKESELAWSKKELDYWTTAMEILATALYEVKERYELNGTYVRDETDLPTATN